MGKEVETGTPTPEDINKLKSSYDSKLAEANKTIKSLTDKLNDIETQLEEAKLAGEDLEDLDQLREKIKETSKELRETQKERDTLKGQIAEREKLLAISKIAAQYGVDEEALSKYETEAEMRAAAADMKIARLEEERKGAPPKEKFVTPKGVGVTADEWKNKSPEQIIKEGIEERDSL